MQNLPVEHPDVYEKFQEGYHVIRRSNREWAGLSSDLVIEQVLMRSLKTTGGLTRGRGMTEGQRLKWILAMPACAQINQSMQQLSGEQNKDMTQARKTRDRTDLLSVLAFCKERNPFSDEGYLRIANFLRSDP